MTPEELNKACEFLETRLYPTVKVLNEDLVEVIDRWELIDDFRKAMGAVVKDSLTAVLTWQDVFKIIVAYGYVPKLNKNGDARPSEDVYKETLKRFNEQK